MLSRHHLQKVSQLKLIGPTRYILHQHHPPDEFIVWGGYMQCMYQFRQLAFDSFFCLIASISIQLNWVTLIFLYIFTTLILYRLMVVHDYILYWCQYFSHIFFDSIFAKSNLIHVRRVFYINACAYSHYTTVYSHFIELM
jgi:hypothetical protein